MRRRKVLLAITRSKSRTEFGLDLNRNGFEVVTADNGLECLQIFQSFSPDVIVIEPELLWGGGDGVLDLIRDDPVLSDVPVLVLTANCNRTAIYSISQFSISDFWVQPIAPSQLTERVSLLADHESWSSVSKQKRFPLGSTIGPARSSSIDDRQFLPVADTS